MKKLLQCLMGLAIYIIALAPVRAGEPVVPDQTNITFMPVPNDQPMTLVKESTTDVRLHPKDKKDTVYYRILSVKGADQTSPITTGDTKVEIKTGGAYEPIHVNESMVNDNGQFVVKAAVKRPDGSFSDETTAAYNIEVLDPKFVTELKYEAPAEFMVGEQYEMWVKAETADAVKEQYQGQNWDFIINWEGVIFSNVEYRFSAEADYVAVDKEDLDDKVLVTRKFEELIEPGIQFRFTIVRKRQTDMNTANISLGIGTGPFMAATYLAASSFSIPFVDRPAADPTFSPAAGYIEKGSAVTIACATAGASIRYTLDGTEPTVTTGQIYENPLTINSRTTIKAVAVTADNGTSFVSEAVYSVVTIPQVTPASGKVVYDSLVKITVSDAEGVEIYYTTDNTEPSATNGTRYTEPFKLRDTVLKVVAVKDGDMSSVVTRKYSLIPAMPEASQPNGATLAMGTKVGLSCATPGVEIYYLYPAGYTSVSDLNGRKYSDADSIEITAEGKLRAIAYYGNNASKELSINYKVNLVAPEFSLPEGIVPQGARVTITSKNVTVDNNNPVKIAYTTDGTEPTATNVKTLSTYTRAIEITEDMTLKAVAWNLIMPTSNAKVSAVTTATYTVLMAPEISVAEGAVRKGTQVTLSCETEGAVIYYTVDGTEPTAASTKYETAIAINSDMTVKAVAVKEGVLSFVTTSVYTLIRPAMPKFEPAGGEVEKSSKVTLSCATGDATLYYTVDGSEPTAESTEYQDGIVIDKAMTVKAVAVLDDFLSAVVTATYTVKGEEPVETVAKPEFSVKAGAVRRDTKVELTCETEEAVIYYTVDGSEPTAESTGYTEAIVIDSAKTIKAIAIKGEAKSEVATAAYTIDVTANEELELAGVSVYPNPSNGVFNITLPVAATIEVFAANGALFQHINASAGEVTLNIHRSGIYFLRITGEGRTVIKRIIVR